MDYDGSDTQEHNLQLTGDGRSKSSSVPRPYAFPRFDFEDSLQGHLRFDSLVESEVFLDIQSQEDNQWIEDFSRGSSAIEFSSSATECCSITRQNNVWSEATSLESVELLLKSVGQEQIVSKDTVSENSNTFNEFGDLTKKMEPKFEHDNIDNGYSGISDVSRPQDELLNNISALDNNVEGKFSQVEEITLSQVHLVQNHVSASQICVDTLEEECRAPVTEGDLLLGTESNDRSEQGVQSTVHESMNITEYGSSHTAVPARDINSDTRSLESSILPDQIGSHDHEGTGNLIRVVGDDSKEQISSQEMPDADNCIMEHHMVSHAMRSDDVPCSFSLSVECADKGTGAEVIINSNESTVMSCTQESQFQLLQGVDKGDSLRPTSMQGKGEAGGLSASRLMTTALTGNDKPADCSTPATMLQGVDKCDSLIPMTMLGEGEVGGLSASTVMTTALTGNDQLADNSELHITNLNSHSTENHYNVENNFGSEPNLDPVKQLDQKLSNEKVDNVIEISHEEGGPGADVSGSLSPSPSIKRDGGDSIVKIINVDVAESLGFPVSSSSVELTKEIGGAPSIKDLHDPSTSIVDGSSFSEGSKKDFKDETEFQLSNVPESGDFSLDAMKEDNISLCTDVIDKSSETCVALTSEQRTSTVMESPSHNKPIINQPQPDVVGKTQPETNSILCKKNNDHVEKENNDDMRVQSFGTESSREDEKEESGGRMSLGASLATLNRSDQVAPEAGNSCEAKSEMLDDSTASQLPDTEVNLIPVTETRRSDQVATEINSPCEAKSDMLHDSTASPLPDTEGKLIPVMETCSTPSGRESQTENLVDCSKGSEVVPGCDGSLLNKGNVAEEFLFAPDPLRAACTSPTIITSNVQIPDERKQERVGGSELASKPSTSEDMKVKDTSGDDNSFTFKVDSLLDVEKDKADNWIPFPIAAIQNSSVVLEGVTTPDVYKIQTRLPQETSGDSPGDHSQGITKTTSGRRKRASGKGSAKENSQTGFNGNDTTPDKPSRKRGTFSSVSLSPSSSQPGQLVGLQPHTERKRKKLSATPAIPTSDLPDLNASALKSHASPPTSFLQPFTDMQQVQLRAQIFVYGSLIQGTAPDEACMVSAFGSSDRERVVWEPLWQAAVERGRSKKPQSTGESPMNSHSTGKVPEVAGKQCSPQTMVFQSPVSRVGNKANPTTILSPIVPLSSPLWSISTPYHDMSQFNSQQRRPVSDYQPAVSPLHTYQIPPVRNIVGHTSWLSQPPCSPSPWASQTTALSVHAPFTTTPASEKIKPTPVKNLSLPAPPSAVKDSPSTPLFPTGGPSTLPPGSSQVPEQNKGTLPSERPSADSKPRRRKKSQASSDIPQSFMLSQSRSEPIVVSPLPTPAPLAPVTTPTCHLTTSMVNVSPACAIPQLQVGCLDVGTGTSCSEETLGKVADAMLQAENAAVLATTALSHCHALWSQLAKQELGIAQEAEAKIAASAGAAAAAASVAKAAAAVAKVASNAALQAKLMADEVLSPSRVLGGAQSGSLVSNVQSVGSATPVSILTGDGGGSSQPGSILLAAREAAKRRIEAASAAAKQAENLDAIVRAAELAAEAVSQAGQIVTMGEPLPLKELINAGPEGYWKLSHSKLVLKSCNGSKTQINVGGAEGAMASSKLKSGGPSGKGSQVTDQGKILPGELSNSSFDEKARSAHGISEPVGVCEEYLGVGKNPEVADMVQGDSSGAINLQDEDEELGVVQGNIIKEGSIIEVYKDNDGLKPAWFSANVLKFQDGKTFVHYTSLLSKEGRENLKEWVTLESEGGKAPRIRPILPITGSYCQGTKKRRRSAMGTYTWNVGDRVDVSIQDSWREGIVTEKNEKDETTLTVHFPARGETSAVSVQQLRPSRIWTNGSWVEWSKLKGHDRSTEGDTPLEKRPRLHSPSKSSKGKNQSSVEADPIVGKPEESKLQTLSASDKVFNIGRSTKAETKPDVRRPLRTGLQKEKSRVVFGVPKPGKKQKFMEVSKHFPANQTRKGNEIKDPVKFTKYLMPQGAASHGRRNPPRVDIKEKQAPKVSTSKPRSSSNRTVPHKGNFVSSTKADDHHEAPTLPEKHVEISEVLEENLSKTAAPTGSSSGTDHASEGSSVLTNLDGAKKKSELLNKRKQVPFGGQLTKVDEEKAPDEVSEPRRSNRRIQPTHRLLEGLQSSMAIPKMSSIPHDKGQGQGQKSRFRTAPSKGK